jgi:hypothetical protein
MISPQTILGYVNAQPFRPFRIHMANGLAFDVRHREMIKVLRSNVLVFSSSGDDQTIPDEWEGVSLMLAESVSHLEPAVR